MAHSQCHVGHSRIRATDAFEFGSTDHSLLFFEVALDEKRRHPHKLEVESVFGSSLQYFCWNTAAMTECAICDVLLSKEAKYPIDKGCLFVVVCDDEFGKAGVRCSKKEWTNVARV